MGESEAQVPIGEVMIGREEKEKKREVYAWVKQNLIKLGKLFGADFQDGSEWHVWKLVGQEEDNDALGVYAPNCYVERRPVWEEIGSIRGLIEGPWAVCGDFNEARYVLEKRNCIRRTIGMREFSDLIKDLNLVDLQLENAKFTWFKGDNHLIASRIDRVLVSQEWDDAFSNLKQYTIHRIVSDHSPITLQGGSRKKSKSYFKFENWLLGTEGFIDSVRIWWNSIDYIRRPDYILASKLKALKHKLKEWSRSEPGNLVRQRRVLLEKLAAMENIATDRGLTEDEATKKASLLLNLEDLIKNEIYWRQRSRSIWLNEGDKNTKFFHKIANAHKRSQRGLRQGDPLSPFLFILVMEGHNNMIKNPCNEGWLRGFEVARAGRECLEITHLQYADDTLIFCDAEEDHLKFFFFLKLVMLYSSALSICPPNHIFGYAFGEKSKSMEIWDGVIKKCEKRLARWKSQYLSLGGILTLINSLLDALPTYMMSLFPVPPGIINRLDSIKRKFLWQGNKERRGYHLVKWKTVITEKRVGGLGIKNMKNQSKALRMKWLWKYSNDNQNL
ncbi:hypothetical protein MTR67_051455 [Solanum verrucosum]|uniref:Reverse transcriptase domain-containing protein n=1 Tax=Solanum verrucosum TaxID=315347 RepID=A0AAF1A2F6_SOLVR|nr:hypothetical protein MTR67_051455 [Solanum verrucosum]